MYPNISMKKKLIMQSFAPLFLILFIRYFDCRLFSLLPKVLFYIKHKQWDVILNIPRHPMAATCVLEFICVIWILSSIAGAWEFSRLQTANFSSQGETLKNVEKMSDSGVAFFMTYVLPMAMDDLNTSKGLLVFIILMALLFTLMWKTNLYYQNPVLTILGYAIFSFQFETTQLSEFTGANCIAITRKNLHCDKSIKRQLISDNVFVVYEDDK